jgi:hypothetical protein
MDTETALALADDEIAVNSFLAENGGAMARDPAVPGEYWLTLRPRPSPHEQFYVRVAWTVYPHRAPSVLFADCVGGALGIARAWPSISGYRAPKDICKPFTAEGFALHTEWVWPTSGNPFLWVVTVLQDDLDTKYVGRAA